MKRILVWHQGALGDLLLSLPAIYTIKRHTADNHLHLVSRTDAAGLILENGIADRVSSNEKELFGDLFSEAQDTSDRLANFLRGFDLAVIFMRRPDHIFQGHISRFVPAYYFINTFPPDGIVDHVSGFQLAQLKSYGVDSGTSLPELESDEGIVDEYPERSVISLQPGSGGRKKCWGLQRYLELVKTLSLEGPYYFQIILGPAEGDEMHCCVSRFIEENRLEAGIVRGMSVSYVASLLERSHLYIGNDSGITHLSALLGTPTIALFGPTDHRIWGPRGRTIKIITSNHYCSACSPEFCRRCNDIQCLEKIAVVDVLEECRSVLNRSPVISFQAEPAKHPVLQRRIE